jgi:sugar O-acyltransferase (sialic acid O-acetyltransferase NeuD family)
MKDIVIIGAGGFGKEVKTIIDAINNVSHLWNIQAFYDDAFTSNVSIIDEIECIGTVDDLIKTRKENVSVVFGISDRSVVYSIIKKLNEINIFDFPNIIHPSIELNSGVVFGRGNVIASGSIFSCDIKVGDFNFFNSLIGVGHDSVVGNFNCFMPRVQISGSVKIGDFNFFGMNSSVIQNKTIENNNIINSYTLLTKNIKSDRKYFGIPGKRIFN